MTGCTRAFMEGPMKIEYDDVISRAQLIATRAQRLLDDEEADWSGYCHPACPLCAIDLAREQLDEEHGWAGIDDARAAGDEAACSARKWIEGAIVQEQVL